MAQGGRDLADYVAAASQECSVTDHRLCNGLRTCETLSELLVSSADHSEGVGADYVHLPGEPTSCWTTAQLLRLVSDNLRRLNVPDRLRRDTQITSALGKLADRGLSADAIIRTGFGPMLIDFVLEGALACRQLVLEKERGSDELLLGEWADLLIASPELQGVAAGDRSLARARAMNGFFVREVQRWLQEAPIAHLVGWRYSTDQSLADDEDLFLLNGRDATVWVCERFTKTYLDEWASESLLWELTFITKPGAVQGLAQFDVGLLEERRVSLFDVTQELARRATSQIAPYQRGPLAELEKAQKSVIAALDKGDVDQAVNLASENINLFPNEPEVKRNFGFCIIGENPERALETLKLYQPVEEGSLVSTLNHFNLVAASYRCNRDAPLESIQFLIDALPAGMPTGSMWLWEPETLRDTPTVVPIELEAWRRRMLRVLGLLDQ